jgi:hypothetical protein
MAETGYRVEVDGAGHSVIVTPSGARYEIVRPLEEQVYTGRGIVWRFLPVPADVEVEGATYSEVITRAAERGFLRRLPDRP